MIDRAVNTVRKRGKNAACNIDAKIHNNIVKYDNEFSFPPVSRIKKSEQYQENLPQISPGEVDIASRQLESENQGSTKRTCSGQELGNSGEPVVEKKSCGIDHSTGSSHSPSQDKKVSYS